MIVSNFAFSQILDALPKPDVIRDRLQGLFAEARVLRSLLRLTNRIDEIRRQAEKFASREP
jgi:hypothetical protein